MEMQRTIREARVEMYVHCVRHDQRLYPGPAKQTEVAKQSVCSA